VRLRVWIAFGTLCVLWGSSYLFIRVGLRHLSPLSLVSLRLLTGAAAITVLSIAQHRPLRIARRVLAILIVLATINTALPFVLISWGEVTVSSGLASVLNSTVPIFSVILAGVVLQDEPVTLARLGGVAVGFGGVILLLSRDLGQATVQWSSVGGQLAIVGASLCYAIGAVMVRRTLRGVNSMTIATWALWIAAIEVTLLSLAFSPPHLTSQTFDSIFAVLWLGLLGSALAYALAFFILEHWGAARYTFVAFMLPVVGLTLGAIFLGEPVDWRILAGSLLVIAGIVLASLAPRRQAGMPPLPEPAAITTGNVDPG